jgi:SOS response regulatory protein OraA/RecX
MINSSIENARQELPEVKAIEVLIKKKTARKKPAVYDVKEKRKLFQVLMGRGFPAGLILNKLGKAIEENSNGEDWE